MKFFIAVLLGVFSMFYYVLHRPYDKTHYGIILDKTINHPTINKKRKHRDVETVYYLKDEFILLVKWEEGFNSLVTVDEITYNSYEKNNYIQLNYDIYKNRNVVFLIIGILLLTLISVFFYYIKIAKNLMKNKH